MRSAAVVLLVLGLVLGTLTTPISTRAQNPSMLDLLPEATDVADGVVIADDGSRSLDEQAASFTDPAEAAGLLMGWGWQENAFRSFDGRSRSSNGTPEVWIDVSVTRFQDPQGAAAALPYFLQDRAVALGQREMQPARLIGDETRALGGTIAGGYDVTLYVRSGPLLMRISTGAKEGSPPASADLIAEGIIARASGSAQQTIPTRPISFYLPETLPPGLPPCLRAAGEGILDFPALVERFPGVPDAAARLEELGWEQGAYRQFSCDDPPPDTVGWIDMSVHRFHDAASAADAIAFFADARARATGLQPAPAVDIGDRTAALSGPVANGLDYTLYLSTGPLLFRVSGVAPAGDPQPSVEYVMSALFLIAVISEGQDQAPGSSAPTATLPTAPSATGAAAYDIVDLGAGNGNWSAASDINDRGQVLWSWGTTQDPMNDRVATPRPMMWWNGSVTDLASIGIGYTIAINDVGTILAGNSNLQGRRYLRYDTNTGGMTPIVEFDDDGFPVDINDAGVVVGWRNGTAVVVSGGTVESVPVPQGYTVLEPAAINEAGHIVGTIKQAPESVVNQRAILFSNGIVTILDPAPGADASSADDLNDVGQVVAGPGVGGMQQRRQAGRAFLYDPTSGTTEIGTLPVYQNSRAMAINNVGQVVGYAVQPLQESYPIRRAFLYDHRTGAMSDLNDLIPTGSGWYLVDAFDINDAGQIVGRGLIGGEMHAFVLTPRR